MWQIVNDRNGISSWEIHRAIGVTQKTAWFMDHRIRHALQAGSLAKMGGTDGGPVEVDEAYVGGEPKNKHLSKRAPKLPRTVEVEGFTIKNPARRKYTDKVPVMGILDREARQVRAQVIPNVDRRVLQDVILENVSKGSTVYTDGLGAYSNLNKMEFVHDTVNHVDEYVRGSVHTQGIENFWSLLKRSLRGTYVAVEPYHLDRYVGEQVFRFNHRKDATGSLCLTSHGSMLPCARSSVSELHGTSLPVRRTGQKPSVLDSEGESEILKLAYESFWARN